MVDDGSTNGSSALHELVEVGRGRRRVTTSVLEGNERLTAEQAGLDADLAMYSAKQAGGDRCVLFARGDVAAEAAPAP